MKRIGLVLLGLFGLLVIAALVVPFLIPADVYKSQIEKSATNALQRDVTLNGDVSISVFPRISASVEDVTVANPEGFENAHMITAGALRGSVKWAPLLGRKVDIQELAFIDADVRLHKLADGRTNWEMPEGEPPTETEDTGRSVRASIASARLENTALSYQDDQAGKTYTLKELDLKASMQDMDEPLEAEGSGIFQEQAFTFDLRLDSPALANAGSAAQLAMTLSSQLANISYTGAFSLGDTPRLDGAFRAESDDAPALFSAFDIDVPAAVGALKAVEVSANLSGPLDTLQLTDIAFRQDGPLLRASFDGSAKLGGKGEMVGTAEVSSTRLRDLLAEADIEMAPGDTLKSFDLKTAISGTFENIQFQDLNLTLDEITGTGSAALDLSGDRPSVTANIDAGPLDLSPFLTASSPPPETSGWSKAPLDLAGLQAVDADLTLTTPQLDIGETVLTDVALTSQLKSGRLIADLSRFKTFGGQWSGKMIVNAQQANAPIMSFNMKGQDVAMSEMLGTLAHFDKLTGLGNFEISAQSSGNSIDAIMNALDGNVSTNLGNGALKGINVGQLVRSAGSLKDALADGSLQRLDFSNVISPTAETDFTNFTSVLTIENGKANIDVLKLLNPVIGMDGSGQIDLAGQALDVRLATSIDKNATSDGSVIQLNGIPVPVRISGAWNNLKVSPDISGVRAALQSELEGQLRDELNNRAGDVLGNILGGSSNNAPADDQTDDATNSDEEEAPKSLEDAAEDAARNALGDLFRSKPDKD